MLSDEDEERLNEELSEMGVKLDLAESEKLEQSKEIDRLRKQSELLLAELCRESLARAGKREQKQEEEIKDLERRLSKSRKEEWCLRKELELQAKAGAEETNSLRQELVQQSKEVERLGKAAESWERTARIDTSEKLRERLGAEMQKTSQLENERSRLMKENAALTITNNGLSTENAELRSSLEGSKTQIQEGAKARLELKEDLQKQTIRAESFLEALKALGVA